MRALWAAVIMAGLASQAGAVSFSFSDKDYLGGASWGTMTITAYDADSLLVRYDAAAGIPGGSQATGFGFRFAWTPSGISNPSADTFTDDQDALSWKVLKNLNAIPNPSNGDEFNPTLTKFDFWFGVTEGNENTISPPGILPGQADLFFVDFAAPAKLTELDLDSFVELTGVRLQAIPTSINGGSLFLAGSQPPATHAPEPATLLLLGSGLVGLAGYCRRSTK